jgi:hypothetical protein
MTTERRPSPDDAPSPEELLEAEALRRALEDPRISNEAAALARAASVAHAPRPIDPGEHRAIVERALARASRARSGVVVRVSFGVAAALAIAAGVALFVSPAADRQAPAATAASTPIYVHSTQPLFAEPFTAEESHPYRTSGSARVDRIAMARASDFRENEFSRWGTR